MKPAARDSDGRCPRPVRRDAHKVLELETSEVVEELIFAKTSVTLIPSRFSVTFGELVWPDVEVKPGTTTMLNPGIIKVSGRGIFEFQVTLPNGQKISVKLVDVKDYRDTLRSAVRRSEVTVDVAGQPVTLGSATYHLPRTVGNVQIDCPITKGYVARANKLTSNMDAWGLDKDARLRLWPAEMLFVSANGWDAWGAKAGGLRVAWCNRAGQPRERLGEGRGVRDPAPGLGAGAGAAGPRGGPAGADEQRCLRGPLDRLPGGTARNDLSPHADRHVRGHGEPGSGQPRADPPP